MTGRALFFSPCAQVCTSGKDGSDEVSSNCGNVHSNYESSWQGLTLVHFSAQPEPFLKQTPTLHTLCCPLSPP